MKQKDKIQEHISSSEPVISEYLSYMFLLFFLSIWGKINNYSVCTRRTILTRFNLRLRQINKSERVCYFACNAALLPVLYFRFKM